MISAAEVHFILLVLAFLKLTKEIVRLHRRVDDLEDANHPKADAVGFTHESEEEEEYE